LIEEAATEKTNLRKQQQQSSGMIEREFATTGI
jgi:hypothetical protein